MSVVKKGANKTQVGGTHYKKQRIEHWDYVGHNGPMDYFQGQITKYVSRWRDKEGMNDLQKARHFLDKYIELISQGIIEDPTKAGKTDENRTDKKR